MSIMTYSPSSPTLECVNVLGDALILFEVILPHFVLERENVDGVSPRALRLKVIDEIAWFDVGINVSGSFSSQTHVSSEALSTKLVVSLWAVL